MTRQVAEIHHQLPCGCDPGYQMCPEAERLWRAAGDAWRRAMRTRDPADWTAYEQALAEYKRHYGGDER